MGKISIDDKEEMKRLKDDGYNNKDIAKKFKVTPSCVRYHLDDIFRKKMIEYQINYFKNMPKEKKKIVYKKRQPYISRYVAYRYNNDEEFRNNIKLRKRERYRLKKVS